MGLKPGISPVATGPAPNQPRKSDSRFRSFAERYLIERAAHFRQDHIDIDTWSCIMDAKRAYKQIEAVGCTVSDDFA